VHFTDAVPIQKPGEPSIARLSHILDIAPMNVSDVSPMALVVEVSAETEFKSVTSWWLNLI